MELQKSKELLRQILSEIELPNGSAAVDRYQSLRSVDAKIRDAKMIIADVAGIPDALLQQMQDDVDFEANSRRVRLETLANLCRSALMFLDSGVFKRSDSVHPAPELAKLTSAIPRLDGIIRARWEEAQRCQSAGCHLASVILMGSILEALLLARASLDQGKASRAARAPKDKAGRILPIHDWKLSALIDVAVEVNWLKADRGKFSHALRDSRNLVHPYAEAQAGSSFDEATCRTCWQVVNASVDDLLESTP